MVWSHSSFALVRPPTRCIAPSTPAQCLNYPASVGVGGSSPSSRSRFAITALAAVSAATVASAASTRSSREDE